jgi:hypothetical protein
MVLNRTVEIQRHFVNRRLQRPRDAESLRTGLRRWVVPVLAAVALGLFSVAVLVPRLHVLGVVGGLCNLVVWLELTSASTFSRYPTIGRGVVGQHFGGVVADTPIYAIPCRRFTRGNLRHRTVAHELARVGLRKQIGRGQQPRPLTCLPAGEVLRSRDRPVHLARSICRDHATVVRLQSSTPYEQH